MRKRSFNSPASSPRGQRTRRWPHKGWITAIFEAKGEVRCSMHELMPHIHQVRSLCQAANVRSLYAFGSLVKGGFGPASDIDLIVDIEEEDPLVYSDHYFQLKFKLQELLKRPIDLLEMDALKNPILRKEIDRTKVLVYGR